MSKNDGGPAFPTGFTDAAGFAQEGMSLRDWFAGQEQLRDLDLNDERPSLAMAEFLAGRPRPPDSADSTREEIVAALRWEADWRAAIRYIRADAMLRAGGHAT